MSPHAVPGNTEKEKFNETLHTSKLALDPLKLSKNVNKSGIKISKYHLLRLDLLVKLN